MASTVPAAKAALLALLQAHSFPVQNPVVQWGGPTEAEDFPKRGELIYFGETEISDENVTLGAVRYDETYNLRVVIEVRLPGDKEQAAEVRAWDTRSPATVPTVPRSARAATTGRRSSRTVAGPARSPARFPTPGSATCLTRCMATRSRRSRSPPRPAYTQTHTLDSAPVKSYTFQKQVPPVLTNTLVPLEYTGVMFSGLTISWSTTGLLTFSMDCVVQEESTSQTAVSYVAPPAWSPFAGVGGSVTIGGVAEANVVGDGSITLGTSMRTDAYALGWRRRHREAGRG
jgi:hypothetical protein